MPGLATSDRRRLALMIDADHIRADFLPIILREASGLGTITVRRLYGHFGSAAMGSWHPLVHEYALTPVHIPPAAVGKNASDMKLASEAMDLLHRAQVECFCLASSDSDFTALASRIREEGLSVYGFGEEKASVAYVRSCDRFFYCDVLLREEKQESVSTTPRRKKVPSQDILAAVDDVSGEDGWAHLGEVGNMLGKRLPDFDPRNFGHKKLSDLMLALKEVELRRTSSGSATTILVRRK